MLMKETTIMHNEKPDYSLLSSNKLYNVGQRRELPEQEQNQTPSHSDITPPGPVGSGLFLPALGTVQA